jgi:hypothetical protein
MVWEKDQVDCDVWWLMESDPYNRNRSFAHACVSRKDDGSFYGCVIEDPFGGEDNADNGQEFASFEEARKVLEVQLTMNGHVV